MLMLIAILLSFISLGCQNAKQNTKHPILKEKNWVYQGIWYSYLDPAESGERNTAWHTTIQYKHADKSWYMAEHIFLGKTTMKAYGVRDDKDNLLDHWFLVKEQEHQRVIKADNADFVLEKDRSGKVTAVIITFSDKNKKVVFKKRVNR